MKLLKEMDPKDSFSSFVTFIKKFYGFSFFDTKDYFNKIIRELSLQSTPLEELNSLRSIPTPFCHIRPNLDFITAFKKEKLTVRSSFPFFLFFSSLFLFLLLLPLYPSMVQFPFFFFFSFLLNLAIRKRDFATED